MRNEEITKAIEKNNGKERFGFLKKSHMGCIKKSI